MLRRTVSLRWCFGATCRPGDTTFAWPVTTEIVDINDAVVVITTRNIPATTFQSGVGVDHPDELPLKQLNSGEYLLRVTGVAGKHTTHHDALFTVR